MIQSMSTGVESASGELKISVIVPTRRPDDLRDFVESVFRQTQRPHELILVDTSNEGDETIQSYLRQLICPSPIKLTNLRLPGGGTVSSRNLALDHATGDIIFILDDDMILDQNYIATIIKFYSDDCDQRIGGIGGIGGIPGYPIYRPPRIQVVARRAFKWLFAMDGRRQGVVLPSGFRTELPGAPGLTPVEWLQGSSSSFRRQAIANQRFDQTMELFPYALSEDVEFTHRIAQSHRLYCTADARLHHKASPGRRLDEYMFYVAFVHNHYHIVRNTIRHPLKYLMFSWAMFGVFLSLLVSAPKAPRATVRKLRGFLKGVAIVLRMELRRSSPA